MQHSNISDAPSYTGGVTLNIEPMPVWESVVVTGAITLLGIICFYFLRPSLQAAGMNEYAAYFLAMSAVFLVMLAWSVLAYLREGSPKTLSAFLQRVRLGRVTPKFLILSTGLALFMFGMTAVFSPLMSRVIAADLLPIPDGIPDYLNPLKQQSLSQIRSQLVSQGIVLYIPLVLLLNILAEELFWRGIILPRQELRHRKNTFLIHGMLWGISHLFQYWLILPITLGAVALSYLVQRTKSTWVGILAHLLNNALPMILMIFIGN